MDIIQGLRSLVEPSQRTVVYFSNVLTLGVGQRSLVEEELKQLSVSMAFEGGYLLPVCYDNCKDLRYMDDTATRKYVKHLSALSAVRSTLHFPYLIEITHTVPYGFEEFMTGRAEAILANEYVQRAQPQLQVFNVLLPDFHQIALDRPAELWEASCLLHNLIGSGISLPDFFSTLAHAMASCERTVILEHNRQSLDFREDTDSTHWFDPVELQELMDRSAMRPDFGAGVPGYLVCAPGMKDACRNMVITFDKLNDWHELPQDAHAVILATLSHSWSQIRKI